MNATRRFRWLPILCRLPPTCGTGTWISPSKKTVEAPHRLEGTGIVEDPLLVGPLISVSLTSHGGAVPLDAKTFDFPCRLHSNAKGPAEGTLRLASAGWLGLPLPKL